MAAAAAFTTRLEELQKQLDLKIIDPKQFEEASKDAQELFNQDKARAKSLFDAETKYAEELRSQQDERVKELSTISQQGPQANDVRTTEGAALVMQIAQGGQDPAIEEYRKQLKKLDEMKKELAKIRQSKVEIR
jgi:chromosome segregation ATPase